MNIRKSILSGMIATTMALGGSAAIAQDAATPESEGSPAASPVAGLTEINDIPLYDAEGIEVGQMDVWEDEEDGGLWFSINNSTPTSMTETKLGVHVHETGVCDTESTFESAGGHFNPTDEMHGDLNADPSHAGDLGNLEVDDEGNFEHEVLAEKLTLMPGEDNSVADEDGSAVVIHAGEDDLSTDPSGESGDRWACGVIVPPADGEATPAAGSEEMTPEATPAG